MVGRHKQHVQQRNYRARKLRRSQIDEEATLWSYLQNRELVGVKFRRQHTIGGFIVDFYSREAKIVMELDGEQHAEEENARYDLERTAFLESKGLQVIRYWNNEIHNELDQVIEDIILKVSERVPHLP